MQGGAQSMARIDFNLHKIFVEGETDQNFIAKILELRFGITFPHSGAELNTSIVSCDGWTKLSNKIILRDDFRRRNNGKNLIIIDADSKNNDGGYAKRHNQLQAIAQELGVKFDIFLFPDNQSEGVLEDFYCSCFRPEMKFFDKCWQSMLGCFEQQNTDKVTLTPPTVYDKVFSYVDIFQAHRVGDYKNSKGKRNYFDSGLWEFDFNNNNNLKSLILFIENCGIVTKEQEK